MNISGQLQKTTMAKEKEWTRFISRSRSWCKLKISCLSQIIGPAAGPVPNTRYAVVLIASRLVDDSRRRRQLSLTTSRRLDFTRWGCTQADLVPQSRRVAHTASWYVTTRNSTKTRHTRPIIPQTIRCVLPTSPKRRLQ